jgi:hypothetical protein
MVMVPVDVVEPKVESSSWEHATSVENSDTRGWGCWKLYSKKEKRPNGYRYQGKQAYLSLDDEDDNGIECVTVYVTVKEKEMYTEYEILILDDAMLTENYVDIFANDTKKVEYEKCFEAYMIEVVLVVMEFPDNLLLLSEPNILI